MSAGPGTPGGAGHGPEDEWSRIVSDLEDVRRAGDRHLSGPRDWSPEEAVFGGPPPGAEEDREDPEDEDAREGNSLLVTFELTPRDGGTLLRMTETGFREMGWEVAVLEQQYQEHVTGWDFYLPRLALPGAVA